MYDLGDLLCNHIPTYLIGMFGNTSVLAETVGY
jgi:hypothetical protein